RACRSGCSLGQGEGGLASQCTHHHITTQALPGGSKNLHHRGLANTGTTLQGSYWKRQQQHNGGVLLVGEGQTGFQFGVVDQRFQCLPRRNRDGWHRSLDTQDGGNHLIFQPSSTRNPQQRAYSPQG